MALLTSQPPLHGNSSAQQHVYRPCHDSTASLDFDGPGVKADNNNNNNNRLPSLPLIVLAAGNRSNTKNSRGKKRSRESSSSSSNKNNPPPPPPPPPPGGHTGRGRSSRGPPRQRRRRNNDPPDDDDGNNGNNGNNHNNHNMAAYAGYVLDERALPCPFHLTDPVSFSRSRHARFSSCHSERPYISTLLRHLSRAAHRMDVTDAYVSSFGCRTEPGRPPQPRAGLCRRCWAVFRDEAAFDAHVCRRGSDGSSSSSSGSSSSSTGSGQNGQTTCVRVALPKKDKFWRVVETFCAVPKASPAGVAEDNDEEEDEEEDEDEDDTESSATPNDYVRRSELVAVQRRLDQLEACLKALQTAVGTAPSATAGTAPPAADDGFVLEDFVDASQLPF